MNPELTTIYIVRHGQSEGNVDHVAGGPDPKLTALGQKQIRNVKKKLKNISFDAIFSSDMTRAIQTAEILNTERKLAIATHKVLRERHFGNFYDGKNHQEIMHYLDILHQKFKDMSDDEVWVHKEVADMESYEEASTRFITFLREVAVGYQGKTLLIIGHGNLMRSFLVKLGYETFSELRTKIVVNGGIIKVKSDGVDLFLEEVSGVEKFS